MTIVSQKTDARNELAGAGFVRAPNVGIVKDATGRVLAPISVTPEAFTTDIADIQGQFPIVWNTERMPYASAVHNTQYYYDNTVVGGAITTTVTTLPIGKGVVSEEGGYVLLDISKDATPQVDNGLSIGADGRIELGGVLHQTTTIDTGAFDLQLLNLNVLSTPTTEALAIDTATGQIGRYNTTIFGAGFMNALQYTTTGNIMSTVSLTLDRPRQAYFDFNQDVSNTGGVVDFAYIEIYVNGVLTFPGFTQGTLIPVADDGLLGEYQFQRADFIALPAGAVTIDARLYSGSGNLFGQNQGRFKVFCI